MRKHLWERIPLRWRVFIATSTTITLLFAAAGWVTEHYVLLAADESIQTEMRASINAYKAIWRARTQVLSSTTALMGAMSDVRAAFMTHDPQTIRDSAQELWSRVSDTSAAFLVLDAEGRLISSLGSPETDLDPRAVPISQVLGRFPSQVSGFVRQRAELFYLVLTPVYVQTSGDPVLLNVLCAGFRVDSRLAEDLKELAPETDFAFVSQDTVFATTLPVELGRKLSLKGSAPGYVVASERLLDISGVPLARLFVAHSYAPVQASLTNLQRIITAAWLLTLAFGLLLSSFLTKRLLSPVKLLDFAASRIAARDYGYRVPVKGTGELPRLAETFNAMCSSIQQAQADMVRQEQMATIARLGSSLVHDLRNPLAAIYGGAEMLIDGDLPPEHSRRIARNIHKASQRMQDLLRDLLNVSKGESRGADFCELRGIVDAASECLPAQRSDVQLEINITEGTEVFCDCIRVERVFTNLFSNAAEAMPQGGKISLSTEFSGDGLEVTVEDSGPGIPDDLREALFRPFVTGKRSGMGLGLALSKQAMIDAGGNLTFESQQRVGACFRVVFGRARINDAQRTQFVSRNGRS